MHSATTESWQEDGITTEYLIHATHATCNLDAYTAPVFSRNALYVLCPILLCLAVCTLVTLCVVKNKYICLHPV